MYFLSLRMEGKGNIMITIRDLWNQQPDGQVLVEEWTRRLNEIPGMNLKPSDKYPSRDLSVIALPESRAKLRTAVEWMLQLRTERALR